MVASRKSQLVTAMICHSNYIGLEMKDLVFPAFGKLTASEKLQQTVEIKS